MNQYNLIIIGFIIASFFLTLWWAFNTIRRIELQKNFCAMPLSSVAKLWHRAKFVPEDAKERESLYLYRDFLRKFDNEEGQYPIMVKDGKVRCMTRKEYDNLYSQKSIHSISILISILSVMIASAAIVVNFFFDSTYGIGIALAAVMPITQIALAFFIARFIKDKDNYRDGIFLALKENSVAFLSITKPFIIVDAYPNKFGKSKKPLFATIGNLTEAQITETRDFIIRQKEAETKIVISNVDNTTEIQDITEKTTKKPPLKSASTLAAKAETKNKTTTEQTAINDEAKSIQSETKPAQVQAPETTTAKTKKSRNMPNEAKMMVMSKLINDTLLADIERAEEKAAQTTPPKDEVIEELKPLPTEVTTTTEPPAEDDFSLEAIGQALDAEIARRKKNR